MLFTTIPRRAQLVEHCIHHKPRSSVQNGQVQIPEQMRQDEEETGGYTSVRKKSQSQRYSANMLIPKLDKNYHIYKDSAEFEKSY